MSDVMRARKKPVEIEACQLGQENGGDIVEWINKQGGSAVLRGGPGGGSRGGSVLIETLEGMMATPIGWWVIKGVKGEFYSCRPDIFDATYDVLDAARQDSMRAFTHPGDPSTPYVEDPTGLDED